MPAQKRTNQQLRGARKTAIHKKWAENHGYRTKTWARAVYEHNWERISRKKNKNSCKLRPFGCDNRTKKYSKNRLYHENAMKNSDNTILKISARNLTHKNKPCAANNKNHPSLWWEERVAFCVYSWEWGSSLLFSAFLNAASSFSFKADLTSCA